jgi:hypothetical protein
MGQVLVGESIITAYLELQNPQIGLYIPREINKEKSKNCECLVLKRLSITTG